MISGLGIGVLSDPKLTGEWEYKLSQIEKGKLTREAFMREIREMTTRIVDSAKTYEGNTVPIENPAHLKARCPKCGGEVVEQIVPEEQAEAEVAAVEPDPEQKATKDEAAKNSTTAPANASAALPMNANSRFIFASLPPAYVRYGNKSSYKFCVYALAPALLRCLTPS